MSTTKAKPAPAKQPKPKRTLTDIDHDITLLIGLSWDKRVEWMDAIISCIEAKDKPGAIKKTLQLVEELNYVCGERLLAYEEFYRPLYRRLLDFHGQIDTLVWDFSTIAPVAESIRQDIVETRSLIKSRRQTAPALEST